MAKQLKNLGSILGIVGIVAWCVNIFLRIPSFLGTENRINIFIEVVSNLDYESYLLPLAFVLYIVFSVIRKNLFALISGIVALALSGWIIYNGNDNIGDIVIAIVAAVCVVAAAMKKN